MSAFLDSLHDFGDKHRIFHKRAAVAVAENFLDGTAHIDVDNVKFGKSVVFCGFVHKLGITAENLHGARSFYIRGGEQFFSAFVAVDKTFCADKLGVRQPRAVFCA